jgi:LPXTG-motif cell wall-anchored protein
MSEDPNTNFDLGEPEPTPPASTSNNRTFIIVAGVIGGLFLLALIALAIFVVIILPNNRKIYDQELAQRNSANTATVAAITSVAATVNAVTPTLPPPTATTVPPSATATMPPAKASATPVVAQPTSTITPTPNKDAEVDSRTATVAALLTQAAQAKLTTTLTTATALPKTGFAEDAGIPGLIGLTILFLVVIFMVRRMRASASPR